MDLHERLSSIEDEYGPIRSATRGGVYVGTPIDLGEGVKKVLDLVDIREGVMVLHSIQLDNPAVVRPVYQDALQADIDPITAWRTAANVLAARYFATRSDSEANKTVSLLVRKGIGLIADKIEHLPSAVLPDRLQFDKLIGTSTNMDNTEIPVRRVCPASRIARTVIKTAKVVIGQEALLKHDREIMNALKLKSIHKLSNPPLVNSIECPPRGTDWL